MAQRLNAQPDQIPAAAQFQCAKSGRGRGNQRADAERRQQRMAQAPQRAAQAECRALRPPARHAQADDHQVIRPGRKRNQHRRRQKRRTLIHADRHLPALLAKNYGITAKNKRRTLAPAVKSPLRRINSRRATVLPIARHRFVKNRLAAYLKIPKGLPTGKNGRPKNVLSTTAEAP